MNDPKAGWYSDPAGISAPYEATRSPDVRINTILYDIDANAAMVVAALEEAGVIGD